MRTGVLLMAHGTPASLDEMPEYLQLVRGGRPASPELVAEMRHHYSAIGGRSPLTALTGAQADALGARLGRDVPVAVGMRNWHPFINDALAGLAASGVERVIGIPMAPQASTIIVHKYVDAAIAGLPQGVAFEAVRSYFAHPLLVEAFAEQVRAARPGAHETIVFTAHSLPSRVIASGDHYAEEVAATASAVAGRAAIARYECAYQSTGRTPEPWIGPDLCGLIKERVAGGARQFLIVPIGFVCDHTEILFDIDIEAASVARQCGATLRRTESLNASPTFISMLEDLVRQCV
ncbi:MAG: ferrochelatase [Acidobacteria bacterium RIFCSPLOWO2_12_FULL_65_11]|nr:MAG: ferrochelatase [Acidobacteria bacterium RIFCSPLOWO2_02_FULL_64_15]OFW34396.1 MAG: ferrochelatase [Acidobacteria bacterium RIFCSPLOWO2_12_FULL_65_11]